MTVTATVTMTVTCGCCQNNEDDKARKNLAMRKGGLKKQLLRDEEEVSMQHLHRSLVRSFICHKRF
jgi:hypothetical protein